MTRIVRFVVSRSHQAMRPIDPDGTPATTPLPPPASLASSGSASRRSRSVADATAVEVRPEAVRAGTVPDVHCSGHAVAHDRDRHPCRSRDRLLGHGALIGKEGIEDVLDQVVAVAVSPDADADPWEGIRAPGVDERLHAAVTGGAASQLDLHAPEWEIRLVVDDGDVSRPR